MVTAAFLIWQADAIAPPPLEVATEEVYVFVAGGTTAGKADATVLIGINDTTLLHRSAATGGKLVARPLPETYAQPVVTAFHPDALIGQLNDGWIMRYRQNRYRLG